MMCITCVSSFLHDPFNIALIILSLALAIIGVLLFLSARKSLSNGKKLGLLYCTAFFFIFPFIFYFYAKTCGNVLYSCNRFASFMYTTLVTIGFSVVAVFIAIPFIHGFSSRNKMLPETHPIFKKMEKHAAQLALNVPRLFSIDTAEPRAFSLSHIKPSIYFTVGLTELLTKKEVEAVLLHELGHIKQRSSLMTFTNSVIRFISPIANFNLFHNELDQEEKNADAIAYAVQKTDKYIISAKEKISVYYQEKNR